MRKMEDSYFPELFGDEEYEEQKRRLLRRLFTETKAQPLEGVDHFLASYSASPSPSLVEGEEKEVGEKEKEREEALLPPFRPRPGESRWKFAFKDLSHEAERPTVICTRGGQLRIATPLEEMGRSWRRKPGYLDMVVNKARIARYENFDGDDHLPLELKQRKTERRVAQKAQVQVAK
jgi:hypothetical protein